MNAVSLMDYHCLMNRLDLNTQRKIKRTKVTHSRKLQRLGISLNHKVNVDKAVINLSSKTLSEDEKSVLALGLSFGLPKFKINFTQHFFSFEKLLSTLKNSFKPCPQWNSILYSIGSLAFRSFEDFHEYKFSLPKLSNKLLTALNNLKKDTSILITRPDKGRGTVVMNRNDYIKKVEQILSDTSKFKVIKEDIFKLITRLEDKLARLLRKLSKLNIITKESYNFISTFGSSPGILYGLPKTHKKDVPVRPVLSTIGSFNYNLAKFLVPIIEPLTTNQYTLKNSFEFVNDIKKKNLTNKIMASFDITSLFTNIPLNETINIIVKQLFKDTDLFMGFTRKLFTEMLELAVKDSPFQFNDKFYSQCDGVAMGNCLGPTFANAFLCYYENIWLSNCPNSFKPLYYKRYVDDTFLLFNSADHIPRFLEYLNSQHENIKFTYEKEENGSLPFLDVLVSREGNHINTSIYRKKSFTGLGTNFMSFIPNLFKINAIKTMLYRCYSISSNWSLFHDEIRFLTDFFMNNGYPKSIIDSCISKFLNKIYENPEIKKEKEKVTTHYLRLPYYGHLSYVIRNSLDKLTKKQFPNDKFMFIFYNPYTLKSCFPFKDKVSPFLRSNVVYQFSCHCCNAMYIGESTRNITHRFAEHKGVSYRTGRRLTSPSYSAIREHALALDHQFSIQDFKVLSTTNSPLDTKIMEALLIQTKKTSLNNQTNSDTLNLKYKNFDSS